MVSISIGNSNVNTIIDTIKELDDNDRRNLIERLNATKLEMHGGPRISTTMPISVATEAHRSTALS